MPDVPTRNAAIRREPHEAIVGEIERHRLVVDGAPEVLLVIWADGTVDVNIGNELIDVSFLGRVVAFVERHADVTVVERYGR